ncbi:hypothetical protein D9V37_16830 [Nocardioides mangrovicus]|uniref:Uncharacterized protein n=1 Tax=Nocardioides mangrovicus TaxID=2478913 RepID=A0A3L8NYR7_9ACTN|nr:hypothetical protein [Nocardioides mangrovicus]RLV47792.1 hypothetical protein D9V37_16830 [Nocardioides mangrovicus]
MNDTELDRALAASDPYPDGVPLDPRLEAAQRQLLEEIVHGPAARRPPLQRTVVLLAGVAAVVVLLVVVSTVVGRRASAPAPAPAASTTPSATTSTTTSTTSSTTSSATPSASSTAVATYSADNLALAASGPRLVLDAPGWSVTHLAMDDRTGEMGFGSGTRTLEVDWYPASSYAGYRDDRARVSAVRPLRMLGVEGRMVTYERGDYAVMLPPARGIFVEIRSQGLPGLAGYRALVAQLRQVDARTWLASLPSTVVVPDATTTTDLLAGIPLPPGFDRDVLSATGPQDSYQYGVKITGAVACGWLRSWTDGDAAARQRAVQALSTSHDWAILKQMSASGDFPAVVWQYADDLAAGRAPTGFEGALGCAH